MANFILSQNSTNDVISRHLAGERVTTQYLDMQTGELSAVPSDEPVPEEKIPVLGTVNAGEHPITEPGYRPTGLQCIEVIKLHGDDGRPEPWLCAVCDFEHGRPDCRVTLADCFGAGLVVWNDENAPCFELLSHPERAQIQAAILALQEDLAWKDNSANSIGSSANL